MRSAGSLTVRNCFLLDANPKSRGGYIQVEGDGRGFVQDTLLATGPSSAAVALRSRGRAHVTIHNCLLACGTVVKTVPGPSHGGSDTASVRLTGNTIRAGACVAVSVDKIKREAVPVISVTAEGNVFDVASVQAIGVPAGSSRLLAEAAALQHARNSIIWIGDGNLFSLRSDTPASRRRPAFCRFKVGSGDSLPLRFGPKNLLSWQDFCRSEGDRSLEREVRFSRSRRAVALVGFNSSAEDFRWSLVVDDGEPSVSTDVLPRFGANVDIIGPQTHASHP